MTEPLRVLVACEYSGTVRDAFNALGHTAMSCDILPTDTPGPHHQGDIFDVLYDGWDLLIAHPPCTYLSNSGVCHLHKDAKRWLKLFDAAEFFMKLWKAPIAMKCIENPVMHKYGRRLIGGMRPTQVVQPWMFGHKEQKATGLYLSGLMPLRPTSDLKAATAALPDNVRQRLHYLPPSPDRQKLRSKTYQGIADAFAMQWGGDARTANSMTEPDELATILAMTPDEMKACADFLETQIATATKEEALAFFDGACALRERAAS